MSTIIVLPVNLIIVTLFRKAKLKRNFTKVKKNHHVAKKKFWRKVRAVEAIELDHEVKQSSRDVYWNSSSSSSFQSSTNVAVKSKNSM